MSKKLSMSLAFEVAIEDVSVPESSVYLTGQSYGGGRDLPVQLLQDKFEAWIDAQKRLQQLILEDAELCAQYTRALLREQTEGQLDALLDDGNAPDVDAILNVAVRRLSETDQAVLRAEITELLRDETVLLDDAVTFQCSGLEINEIK